MPRASKPVRRTRVVAAVVSLYCVGVIALLVALRPAGFPSGLPDRDAPAAALAAAAADAIDRHPLGNLLVPHEHRALRRYLERFGDGDDERSLYVGSSLRAYYIVLDEMTWLIVGLLAAGLVGGLLALRAGPLSSLWGGIVMLLAVPGPIASVGPSSIVLTAPLLLGGILVLALRPRVPRPALVPAAIDAGVAAAAGPDGVLAPAFASSGAAEPHPGRQLGAGLGLLALGIASAALAAGMRSDAVKLWIGAATSLGFGLYLVVAGIIGLGKRR